MAIRKLFECEEEEDFFMDVLKLTDDKFVINFYLDNLDIKDCFYLNRDDVKELITKLKNFTE